MPRTCRRGHRTLPLASPPNTAPSHPPTQLPLRLPRGAAPARCIRLRRSQSTPPLPSMRSVRPISSTRSACGARSSRRSARRSLPNKGGRRRVSCRPRCVASCRPVRRSLSFRGTLPCPPPSRALLAPSLPPPGCSQGALRTSEGVAPGVCAHERLRQGHRTDGYGSTGDVKCHVRHTHTHTATRTESRTESRTRDTRAHRWRQAWMLHRCGHTPCAEVHSVLPSRPCARSAGLEKASAGARAGTATGAGASVRRPPVMRTEHGSRTRYSR